MKGRIFFHIWSIRIRVGRSAMRLRAEEVAAGVTEGGRDTCNAARCLPAPLGRRQLHKCEAASIIADTGSDKRARTAALTAPKDPPPVKSVPTPPPPPAAIVAAVTTGKGEGKDKGGWKGKGEGSQQVCHKFSDGSGCRFGDACIFKHDRARARLRRGSVWLVARVDTLGLSALW